MSISFIVATSGRSTLAATLRSIETFPGDEIIIVGENIEFDDVRARYINCPAGNDWGHSERNFAMPQAAGRYLAHIDDDDTYVFGHRAIMEREMQLHPDRPIIFRMQYQNGIVLWAHKIAEVGNVGTPMSLLPNIGHQGRFGLYYGGDIEYLDTYGAVQGYSSDDYIWCEDVTILIRPHTAA